MKGRVVVEKKNLEARFAWAPDKDGSAFDVEILRSLLLAEAVRVEVSDTDLEKALEFFNTSEGPGVSEVVARGLAPTEPVPLTVELNPQEMPSAVKGVLDSILKEAAPFEGDYETAWADTSRAIASVQAAVAARAGLDLNRDPIAAAEPEGVDFHVGSGLEIRGKELWAVESGILRFGSGGADLLPCRLHEWSLKGGPQDGGCFLDYKPGHDILSLPAISEILSSAGHLGFVPEKIVDENMLRSLLAEGLTEGTELSGYPISRDTDGLIAIEIDSTETLAELVLRRESGEGTPLELKSIATVIRGSGFRGLDGDGVKAAIMTFWKSGDSTGRIPIKKGKIPERGPDRELEYLIPFLDEEDAAPIRERLEFEPDRVRGIPSLKEFPPAAVSKVARVENEQSVARLGTVRTGKSGKDLNGKVLPGYPGNDPDIRVHEGMKWEGDVLLAECDGMMDIGTIDGVTHLRIRPHMDATVRVSVTEDKMKAFVSTRAAVGTGSPLDADRIRDEAEKNGVIKGFLEDAIEELVERALTGEIMTGVQIAEGHLPMQDKSRLSLSVDGDPSTSPVPVKAGDIIGTVSSGEDSGWNVLGDPMMEGSGALSEGEGILRKEEDGQITLTAEKGGHLEMSDGRLYVKDLMDYVGDVSMASGNIRFPGRIKIDGSILSRVIVDAGEGVEVTQVVQAALVNSGGGVTIGKGIKGEGKAVIRSQGKMVLGYAEDANLLSTGDIHVSKTLLNCRVKCNGKLHVDGKDGRLIGGVMKLKDGLNCSTVGNERGAETVVSFGQDYLVENQIDQVQREMAKIQEFINKTDDMMADLEQKPGSGKKLIMVRQKKVDALKMLEKKSMRIFLLREKFERHFESEVLINGTAWPGVTFESHGRLLKVKEPLKSIRVFFDREKGQLAKKPI